MNYFKKNGFMVMFLLVSSAFISGSARVFVGDIAMPLKQSITKDFNSFLKDMKITIDHYDYILKKKKVSEFSDFDRYLYLSLQPFDAFLNNFKGHIPKENISYDVACAIIDKTMPLVGKMPYVFAKKFIDFADKVNPELPVSRKERESVIGCIRSILPSLADQLTVFSEVEHINRLENAPFGAAMVTIASDGLPEIFISQGLTMLPEKELQFILAHELAHYFLGHHRQLEPSLKMDTVLPTGDSLILKSDASKTSSHLFFERAYTRAQESEADRFAVLTLRADIDAAQSLLNKLGYARELESFKNGSFDDKLLLQETHPLSLDRAKNLESLRHVLSVPSFMKASDNYKASLDWRKIKESWLTKDDGLAGGYPEYLLQRAKENKFPEEISKAQAMIAARSEKD